MVFHDAPFTSYRSHLLCQPIFGTRIWRHFFDNGCLQQLRRALDHETDVRRSENMTQKQLCIGMFTCCHANAKC